MDRVDQLEKLVEHLQQRLAHLESWISANINHANIVSPFQTQAVWDSKPQTPLPVPCEVSQVSPDGIDGTSVTRIQPESPTPVAKKVTWAAELEVTQELTPVVLEIVSSSDKNNDCVTVTAKIETSKTSTEAKGPASSPSCIPVLVNAKSSAYRTPEKSLNSKLTSANHSSITTALQSSLAASLIASHQEEEEDISTVTLATSPATGSNSQGISSTTPTQASYNGVYCKKCFMNFSSLKIYTLHKTKVHLKFACKFCPSMNLFEERVDLFRHVNSVHLRSKLSQKKVHIAGDKEKPIEQQRKVATTTGRDVPHPDQSKSPATLNLNQINYNDEHDFNNNSIGLENTFCCHHCHKTFQHTKHLKQHLHTHQERDTPNSAAPHKPLVWRYDIDMNGNWKLGFQG